MFVAINRLKVPAEYGSHLEQAFQRNAGGMAGVAGFVSFDLLRAEEGGEYLVVTRWTDKPSFEAWREGDAFSRAHGDVNPNSPVRSELGTYEIVISKP
jgi:heme oxygenase (staphylobilin-producing)